MTQSGTSLKVEGLIKSWGNVEILKKVNFEIQEGGFLTLLGPSGCGKSTALRLISGLDETDGGKIFINNKEMTHLSAAERNLGMVFQNYALFPHMTIAENITYGLKIRKVSKPDIQAAVKKVAALMSLEPLLDRKPSQLSGGQQQRVALARVLVSERPLVLMDEPLSNLDAKLRVEIRREIKALNKQLGITIVYVTHDQSEALSMSDTVVLMNAGQVVQAGTPKELYNTPATIFAASFIGTPPMNILDCKEVSLPDTFSLTDGSKPKNHKVGVRPENLVYGNQQMDFSIKGLVVDIQYEGNVDLVHLKTYSGSSIIYAHSGSETLKLGQEIILGWDKKSMHLFSNLDEKSIDFEY